MKTVHDPEWYQNRSELRKASAAVASIVILYLITAQIVSAILYFTHIIDSFTENIKIALNGPIQLICLVISIGIVSLFYSFKPLEFLNRSKQVNLLEDTDNTKVISEKKYKYIIIVFPILIAINYVAAIFIQIFIKIIESTGTKVPEVSFQFNNLRPTTLLFYFSALCIFAPIIEEFLFRGCILKILKPFGNWFAIIISSIFFALLHGNIAQSFGAFFIGVLFGFIAVKTKSLVPSIILHAMNNFYIFLGTVITNLQNNKVLLSLYGFFGILLFISGIALTIIYNKKFSLTNDNTTCLTNKKIYATFFLNIVVILYLLIQILLFVSSFLIEN